MSLVEAHLRDLSYRVGWESVLCEHETVPAERIEDNPLRVDRLSPENVGSLSEEGLAEKRLDADAARAARFTL